MCAGQKRYTYVHWPEILVVTSGTLETVAQHPESLKFIRKDLNWLFETLDLLKHACVQQADEFSKRKF